MRLELSRRAQVDLDDIRDFSVEHFGIPKAISYLDAIEAAFRRLLAYPDVGSTMPTIDPTMRSISCGQHRIFYTANADHVLIVRILHQSMDARRHRID